MILIAGNGGDSCLFKFGVDSEEDLHGVAVVEFLFGHCSSVVAIIEVYYCFSPFAVPYFCWASCLLILSMSPIVSQVVPDFLAAATASFTRFWADSCSR